MLHGVTPEQSDLNLGAKQNQVCGRFQGQDGGVVLRIEVMQVVEKYVAGGPPPFYLGRSQVQPPFPAEFFQHLLRLRERLEHGVYEIKARSLVGEDVREKISLGDLRSLLSRQ